MASQRPEPPPLTREQVLDELHELAAVEHALCVEYLFLWCALGDGLTPSREPTDVERDVAVAAAKAFELADREMRLLAKVNRALVAAARGPNLRRATRFRNATPGAAEVVLAPLTAAQLDGFEDREHAIAAAVDARYALLPTTLEPPPDPDVEDPLSLIAVIVEDGTGHAAAFAELRAALAQLEPAQFLRARSDQPADELQRDLRAIADAYYEVVLVALRAGLAHAEIGISPSVSAMQVLGDFLPRLVELGLLPAFTLPQAFA
ncbi:MAG: hypothetical protein QOI73_8 [Solirubrobacteraceae bacterium]|nr:hypothetical protein [Solirubrobacteraceae bacterium]